MENDRNSDGSVARSFPVLLKLGVTKHTQLSVQAPVLGSSESSTGLGDISVGLKWRVAEDQPLLQDVALLPQVKLATGGSRGTGTTDVGLLLINSRTMGSVGLDLNAGITRRSGDGTRAPRTSTMWAVAAGIPVRGMMGWTLECYGNPGTGGPVGAVPLVAILTGPTFTPRQDLEFDLGFITPLAGQQPHAFYLGLVSNAGVLIRRAR